MKKRQNGKTIEQRIWTFIRRNGTVRGPEIIKGLGISNYSMRSAIGRLQAKGCLISTGATNDRRHRVSETPPEDMRGTSVGSLLALQATTVAQKRFGGRPAKAHPRVLEQTTLERCWKKEGTNA